MGDQFHAAKITIHNCISSDNYIIMHGNYQSLKLSLIGVINDQGVDRMFWCDDVSNYKLQKIGFCITMIMN